MMHELKTGFKRTVNWNNYESKWRTQTRNQYLDYSIDPSFPGVNIYFVLSFENNTHWIFTSNIFFQL